MANEILNIVTRVTNAIKSERIRRTALITTLAEHKPRIFEKGMTANGGKIGTYSTNPISISKARQARNTGRTYFPGGESEYHSAIGKNPGFVILRDTDQMMGDYGLVVNGENYGFGFQNEENYKKSQWTQDHFDADVFMLSDSELDRFTEVLLIGLNNAI